MYTAKLIGDTKNIELRRRMINIEFTSEKHTFNKEFQFSIQDDVDAIKKTVKYYLDELNFTPPEIKDLTITEETPVEPTQAEKDKQAWEKDKATLRQLQDLIDIGVFKGDETPIVNLRAKVKTNFKTEYLG